MTLTPIIRRCLAHGLYRKVMGSKEYQQSILEFRIKNLEKHARMGGSIDRELLKSLKKQLEEV
jgi:hypothetical protein